MVLTRHWLAPIQRTMVQMWETQVTKYVLNYSHTTARRKSREYTRIRARALVCLSKALHTPSLSFSVQCMESAQYLSWCPLNCTSNVDYTNQPHVVLEFSCMSHIWTKFQHPFPFPISSHTWSNILPPSIKKNTIMESMLVKLFQIWLNL